MLSFGVLGLNERNLNYIKRFNPKKVIRLLTNKAQTKKFLKQRGVPLAATYGVLKTRQELYDFDFGTLASPRFVIKPNKGSKGKWIFIVTRIPAKPDVQKQWLAKIRERVDTFFSPTIPSFPYQYKVDNEYLSDRDLKRKFVRILDGDYTLGNKPDSILIEEKLVPGQDFAPFCQWGLADIRVIVFNLTPIAAMVRVPTAQSHGKANLAQWGIAFGIDIATGKIQTLKDHNKLYTSDFPSQRADLYHAVMPFWDDILLYSSNVQFFLNVGYVGIDRVVTPSGPKMLEANALSWLEMQNIAQVPLENILDKIKDINIQTPEQWVQLTKSLFAPHKTSTQLTHKILYLSQRGQISYEKNGDIEQQSVIVKVHSHQKYNYTSDALLSKLPSPKKATVMLDENNLVLPNISLRASAQLEGNQIVLWSRSTQKFYIKPIHKSYSSLKFIKEANILDYEVQSLQIFDQQLYNLTKRLTLGDIITPHNYIQQLDKFVTQNGNYNPTFKYDFPAKQQLNYWQSLYEDLVEEFVQKNPLKSPFANLRYNKLEEANTILKLIRAYSKQDYEKIAKGNKKLFGNFDKNLLKVSKQNAHHTSQPKPGQRGRLLSASECKQVIEAVLADKNITGIPVKVSTQSLSRISVIATTKSAYINLSSSARFYEYELHAKIVHEIDIHLQRFLAGKKKWRLLLQKWTAGYIAAEEGLAIRLTEQKMQEFHPDYHNYTIYKNYLLAYEAQHKNFRELIEMILDNSSSPEINYKKAFNKAIKLKKGIIDTSTPLIGASYLKDKVYLDGYMQIKNMPDLDVSPSGLLMGKITPQDLEFI